METALDISKTSLSLSNTIKLRFDQYAKGLTRAYCHLLVDPTLRDISEQSDFAAALKEYENAHDLDSGQYRRILWRHEKLVPAHRPYLIPLDLTKEADTDLLQISVEMALLDWQLDARLSGQGHRICGWLFGESAAGYIADHLGFQAVQPRSAGKHVLLRYFDPGVMPHLWALGDVERQSNLLGPIAQWIMLEEAGWLRAYMASHSLESSPKSLNYSDVEWSAIENIGPLNQALTRWEYASGNRISDKEISNTRNALARARKYGFNDVTDLIQFAMHSLNIHPRFDQHPAIQTLIKSKSPNNFYGATIAPLEELHWQQIKATMTTSLHTNEQ